MFKPRGKKAAVGEPYVYTIVPGIGPCWAMARRTTAEHRLLVEDAEYCVSVLGAGEQPMVCWRELNRETQGLLLEALRAYEGKGKPLGPRSRTKARDAGPAKKTNAA